MHILTTSTLVIINKYCLSTTNDHCKKYLRINIQLCYSNNASKMSQQLPYYGILNLNKPIRNDSATTIIVIWIATQPISYYYDDTENVITF